MKIKILKPVIVEGVAKKKGDVVEVGKNIRNLLVKMGKAEDVSNEDVEALEKAEAKAAAAKAKADAKAAAKAKTEADAAGNS